MNYLFKLFLVKFAPAFLRRSTRRDRPQTDPQAFGNTWPPIYMGRVHLKNAVVGIAQNQPFFTEQWDLAGQICIDQPPFQVKGSYLKPTHVAPIVVSANQQPFKAWRFILTLMALLCSCRELRTRWETQFVANNKRLDHRRAIQTSPAKTVYINNHAPF